MATKKKVTKPASKAAGKAKTVAPGKAAKAAKPVKAGKPAKAAAPTKTAKAVAKPAKATAPTKTAKASPVKPKTAAKVSNPAVQTTPPPPRAATPPQKVALTPATGKVTESVTAKKTALSSTPDLTPTEGEAAMKPVAKPAASGKKATRTTLDDLALDVDEKDELLEEEKRDLAKALRDDDDELLETAFVPTDTSERIILVVDEEGQRRTETVSIVQQILPNAVIEMADDPEEALEVMEEAEFDTYVVNFLMPGFSASPFVKAVTNHPDRPLLIGFAADKISDALDQRKGLKIIPLKRLFDLDVPADAAKEKAGAEE